MVEVAKLCTYLAGNLHTFCSEEANESVDLQRDGTLVLDRNTPAFTMYLPAPHFFLKDDLAQTSRYWLKSDKITIL
jgi:hypothetical protein